MTAITRALAICLSLAGLLVATTPGWPAPPGRLGRQEALEAMQNGGDVQARRAAVEALGETGTRGDQPVLLAALRDEDALVRALAERALWLVWGRSGDPEIDRLFTDGVAQMGAQTLPEAVQTFTRIIERKPEFAEAWNKRATIYYFLGELDKSLADCDEVIARNPEHFGALSGYGLIYLQLDQPARALAYFERALAVNPNLHQIRSVIEEIRRELRARGDGTI